MSSTVATVSGAQHSRFSPSHSVVLFRLCERDEVWESLEALQPWEGRRLVSFASCNDQSLPALEPVVMVLRAASVSRSCRYPFVQSERLRYDRRAVRVSGRTEMTGFGRETPEQLKIIELRQK
jgi:hypothetical protein